MTNHVVVADPNTNKAALVTDNGQVVTAPISYDSSSFVTFDTPLTAETFVPPIAGKDIIITGALISSTRSVGNEGTEVTIYKSDGVDSLNNLETIIEADLARQEYRDLIPLNINAGKGVWINGVVTDAVAKVTLIYYYL